MDKDLNCMAQIIYDKKGSNILALDLRKISNLTDYVLIAEGFVGKHVSAIAEAIVLEMKKMGREPLHVEGLKEGNWVVLDFSNILVHLFQPGWREIYQLERLWRQAEIIDLQIETSQSEPTWATHFSHRI